MYDFRAQLTYTDTRRLAPFGEGCALFSALCACVFVFLIGFIDRRGLPISLIDAFGQNTPGSAFSVCAALLGLAAVCVLFGLTVLRYVRFWLKKTQKDSLYFSYATAGAYLAAILLFSACNADGERRLNTATVAGLILVAVGIAASVVLFLLAKGRQRGRETAVRYVAAVIALLLLLTLSALFSTGVMAEDDRQGLALLFSDENAVGSRTAAAFFFVFLVGYAACNVLLLERLLGNIAQRRKPTALRAALTAVCAILAAACEGSIASVSDELLLLFFWGIPGFAVLAALLLFLTVLADTLCARAAQTALQ